MDKEEQNKLSDLGEKTEQSGECLYDQEVEIEIENTQSYPSITTQKWFILQYF